MKKFFREHSRTFLLTAVLLPLVLLFAWVSLRSGPLAPVPVTLMTVERSPITPSLFGIGTVEARFTHKIGPTFTGRLASVQVQTGDRVQAGQLLLMAVLNLWKPICWKYKILKRKVLLEKVSLKTQ